MPTTRKSKAATRTLATRYVEFLADEGYRPEYEPDEDDDQFGVVSFKCEGTNLLLFVYEDDPDYFNVGCAFDVSDTPCDAAALAGLAAHVNGDVKGVKCSIAPDHGTVRFQVETFLCGAEPTSALLRRSIDALRHAAGVFFEKRVPPEHLDA